jgi:hypothetical protein
MQPDPLRKEFTLSFRFVGWSLILDDNTKQDKIALLALLANSYKDLLEITTNGSIVTEALASVQKMKDGIGTDNSKGQSAQGEQNNNDL